ncbi:DUF4350 domain-containing protein [Mucilaginibacter pocheonensis]|uniref:Unsaturated rhamnogalacturonyl hydrolase n=1 Tax=Mucilaginibacter pocheonensis TaxID=398050 RepID=A0ABU1T6U3_9SPHI|nr:DUF4350 domain-containing protein [Mucilaginibacter pocheonensis]MDR6941109.1 unsaturated rhamnogalacturonyl hydrolase [Mucilaginibacter pocheonensis]
MKLKVTIITLLVNAGLVASAQTVTLDYYFNHEVHKNAEGQPVRFHYLWTDKENTGFSIFGDAFTTAGAKLDTLNQAPTTDNLKDAAIYIIVDPDSKKESPSPNYIQPNDVEQIAKWVKKGGILLLMANDSANVELPHFNTLAAKFGMHFNNDLQNHVIDDAHFEDGAVKTTGNPVFKTAGKIFMKDVCSISTSGTAVPVLKNNNGATIIASAKYGKGTVVAVGDPWLYNEYTNGRLPAGYENDKAADDIVQWLLQQISNK